MIKQSYSLHLVMREEKLYFQLKTSEKVLKSFYSSTLLQHHCLQRLVLLKTLLQSSVFIVVAKEKSMLENIYVRINGMVKFYLFQMMKISIWMQCVVLIWVLFMMDRWSLLLPHATYQQWIWYRCACIITGITIYLTDGGMTWTL